MSIANVQVKIADTMSVPASTLALVNNGASNAYVGEEIVGVVDAADLGGGSYRIGPTLVRGMRGSPVSAHAAGETFAAAPSVGATTKVEVDPQYVGQRVWVRVLSPGQDLDDSAELSCVIASPTSPYVTHLPIQTSETPAGAVDGVNAGFALSRAPIPGSQTVYVNGAAQPGSAYALAGATVTFATPPAAGSALFVAYSY